MKKLRDFYSVLAPILWGEIMLIDYNYNLWDSYEVIESEEGVVKLTLVWPPRKAQKAFDSIIKAFWAEKLFPPHYYDLSYKDSLRMFFNHFPYWVDNSSNWKLVNEGGEVLATIDNWCKSTRTIISEGPFNFSSIAHRNKEGEYSWKN